MSGNLCRCGAYVNIVKAISNEVPAGSDLAEPLSAISRGDTTPYPPAGRPGNEGAAP
jgi:xanthine dehydrogenase iron-sulfur cluster and FAD-binding subunit A